MGCRKPLPIGVHGEFVTAGSGREPARCPEAVAAGGLASTRDPSPPPLPEEHHGGGGQAALTEGPAVTPAGSGFQFFRFCLLLASGPGMSPLVSASSAETPVRVRRAFGSEGPVGTAESPLRSWLSSSVRACTHLILPGGSSVSVYGWVGRTPSQMGTASP